MHPDALLAGYVDGSADEQERQAVAAHLADCPRCLGEVAAARRGLDAARSLENVEAPAIGPAVMAAVAAETPAWSGNEGPVPGGRRRGWGRGSRTRWSHVTTRVAAATGIAAVAAGTIALLVLVVGGNHGPNANVAGAPAAVPGRVSFVDRGNSYTTSDLVALAGRLATRYSGKRLTVLQPAATPASAAFERETPANPLPSPAAQDATCLQRGGAPTSSPVYLEVATVDGKPAFVGAYLLSEGSGLPNHLALVAVARSSCQPIFLTSRKI